MSKQDERMLARLNGDKGKMPAAEDVWTPTPNPFPSRRNGAVDRTRFGAFKITPTGLEVGEDVQQKDWLEAGTFIFQVESGIQWLIGDWLLYGIQLSYGDMQSLAEHFERDASTLHTYKQMAENIEFTRRRVDLSFAHHQEVRKLSAEDQDYALAYAAEHGLSRSDFRKWLRGEPEQKGTALPDGKQIDDIGQGEEASDIDAILRDAKKFMQMNPAKAKPQEHEHVRKISSEMRRAADDLDRKWGIE